MAQVAWSVFGGWYRLSSRSPFATGDVESEVLPINFALDIVGLLDDYGGRCNDLLLYGRRGLRSLENAGLGGNTTRSQNEH